MTSVRAPGVCCCTAPAVPGQYTRDASTHPSASQWEGVGAHDTENCNVMRTHTHTHIQNAFTSLAVSQMQEGKEVCQWVWSCSIRSHLSLRLNYFSLPSAPSTPLGSAPKVGPPLQPRSVLQSHWTTRPSAARCCVPWSSMRRRGPSWSQCARGSSRSISV